MMQVQTYLNDVGPRSMLTSEFGIKVRDYEDDNLYLLDYSQIDSPKSHPITMECRSLILDDMGNVVSRSFDRFFNWNEMPEFYADFDFSNALIFEKADGSLIKVYYNPHTDKWEISTRGMAKAEGDHVMGGSFRSKVLDAFGFANEKDFQEYAHNTFVKSKTYIWEYCSPENRVVTPYTEAHMVLLGIRDNDGTYSRLWEMECIAYVMGTADSYRVRMAKVYPTASMEDLVEASKVLPNLEEGYVVWCQTTDKRIKIKSPTYVIAHRMRGEQGLTPKNIMSLILEGEVEEYLSYFPDDRKFFEGPIDDVVSLETAIQIVWERAKDIEDQKEFALAVKDMPFGGILFTARKMKADPVKVFHDSDIKKKLKLFGIG